MAVMLTMLVLSVVYAAWVGYENNKLTALVQDLDAKYEAEQTKKAGIVNLLERQIQQIRTNTRSVRDELAECKGREAKGQ